MKKKRTKKNEKLHNGIHIAALTGAVIFLIAGIIFLKPSSQSKTATITPTPTPHISVAGSYSGVFPCADCRGLDTELSLTEYKTATSSGNYILTETYEGKLKPPFITTGVWKILYGASSNPYDKILKTVADTTGEIQYYKVIGNSLLYLDSNEQPITSPYKLELTKK